MGQWNHRHRRPGHYRDYDAESDGGGIYARFVEIRQTRWPNQLDHSHADSCNHESHRHAGQGQDQRLALVVPKEIT